MIKNNKIIALIPLRGGSKSIIYKNIKIIAGKPLSYWSCLAAKNSEYIDEVYVSTEDMEIKKVVKSFNLGIKIIDRPQEFSTDTASTESVMLDFMDKIDFDVLITIQATSPLTSGKNIDEAVKQFIRNDNDSLLTGVLTKRFYWTKDGDAINYNYRKRPRRQEFDGSIMENGAFYITRRAILKAYKNRLGGNIGIFEMSENTAQEIDESSDWTVVEKSLLVSRRENIKNKLKNIKIIFSDFDGVWTDNKIYTDSVGNEILCFSKEDSLGLNYFKVKIEIPILIISKERNIIVEERCKKLQLQVLTSIDDKVMSIENELEKRNLKWADVCYIGNDINDLECIRKAKFSLCPQDANKEVKENVNFVLNKNGGDGAIREFFNLFINNYYYDL